MNNKIKNLLSSFKSKAIISAFAALFVLSIRIVDLSNQDTTLLRPTKVATLTPTIRATRVTPDATTPTLTASPSQQSTVTPTISPSATPTAPTATPGQTTHDVHEWHLPSNEPGFQHHHGVNPNDYTTVFGEPLVDYLATYGEISYPWATTDENQYFGYGHHNGYVWIYDHAEGGCERFNNGGQIPLDELDCVTDVLIVVHSDGSLGHIRKRFHSHYAFMRVCDEAGVTCGVVATGGWVDFGIFETPYKEVWCPLPGTDPLNYTTGVSEVKLDQPSYRTSQVEVRASKIPALFDPAFRFFDTIDLDDVAISNQFWSGLRPNYVISQDYELGNGLTYPFNVPNQTLGVAWSSLDAWGVIDPANCANPELDVYLSPDGSSAWNNTAFQIFTIFLYQHPPAPESGMTVYWTNRWGLILDEPCVTASVDCVPFYVTAGVPDGGALLNRQVDRDMAPVHEFDLPGVTILPAPLEP